LINFIFKLSVNETFVSDSADNVCEVAGLFRFLHVLEEAMEGWLFALVHEKALEFTGRG
jgi:hypothetical protein